MSHETFKVGEIAILHSLVHVSQYNETECEILGPLDTWPTSLQPWNMYGEKYGYRVRHLADGTVGVVHPKNLRKRRPPPTREPVSTWDDVIVWRPKETSHV